VLRLVPFAYMPSPLPRQVRWKLIRSYIPIVFGLPRASGSVGSCINLFEACSAFTHITACMLAESPMRPSTPKASAASLPPLLLRLLPGGANQFPVISIL